MRLHLRPLPQSSLGKIAWVGFSLGFDQFHACAKSLSILNRLIPLQIFHGWWTCLVHHTGHLHPLHSVLFYFCASIESTERQGTSRSRSPLTIHRLKIKCRFWRLKNFQLTKNELIFTRGNTKLQKVENKERMMKRENKENKERMNRNPNFPPNAPNAIN